MSKNCVQLEGNMDIWIEVGYNLQTLILNSGRSYNWSYKLGLVMLGTG